ncbi:MAG: hypothetical protein WD603_00170 [Patescibacteria group bacterium]
MSAEHTEGHTPDQHPPADELFEPGFCETSTESQASVKQLLKKALVLIEDDDHDLNYAGRMKLLRVLDQHDRDLASRAYERLLEDATDGEVVDDEQIYRSSRMVLYNPAFSKEERVAALEHMIAVSREKSAGDTGELLNIAGQMRDAEIAKRALKAAGDRLACWIDEDNHIELQVRYIPFGHPLPEVSLAAADLYEGLVNQIVTKGGPRRAEGFLGQTSYFLLSGAEHSNPNVQARYRELWKKYRLDSPERLNLALPVKKIET